ncbi:zeta toxin family protein [Calothrix sp. CCY 0018]|uniref:zeta toxin family protein n=1 Tax=Calothrix sp. CCY 0018 TaxID=3103864 RepID=UPI0039C757A7
MKSKPILIIIAGSNGSGKSTLTRRTFQRSNLPIIDPDAIARGINPSSPESVSIAAGRQAINLTRNYLDNGQSFIAETTLSGNNYLRIMDKAKAKGFEISLIYIGINNIDTSINRVQLRVQRGGHNVPPLDIRRRYERSLLNLPLALLLADKAIIYDNSTELGHQKVLLLESNQIVQSSGEIPQWIIQCLPQEIFDYYNDRLKIIQEIYPIINRFKERFADDFTENSPNIQKLSGKKYNIVIDNNAKELTLSAPDSRGDLFTYNQSNNQVIFVSHINETDKSIWLTISQLLNRADNQATIIRFDF